MRHRVAKSKTMKLCDVLNECCHFLCVFLVKLHILSLSNSYCYIDFLAKCTGIIRHNFEHTSIR